MNDWSKSVESWSRMLLHTRHAGGGTLSESPLMAWTKERPEMVVAKRVKMTEGLMMEDGTLLDLLVVL